MISSTQPGRPPFTEQDAARLAQQLFAIHGTARALPSERDQNFYIEAPDGERYVLKIANRAEEPAVLEMQNRAMAHLAGRVPGLVLPRLCRAISGKEIEVVRGEAGTPYLVRLLTYLPGTPLATYRPHSPALLEEIGRALGEMSRALATFDHPAARRKLKWNAGEGCRVIEAYLPYVEEAPRREMVEHFLARFRQGVEPRLPSLRQSVIHNDANDYNLLVYHPAGGEREIGLLDFGDMIQGPTVCELAVALAYLLLGKEEPLAAALPVIRGYHARFPLQEEELSLLYDLICMRLCMSVTIAAYQQRLEPANEYLGISEAPAWQALERLSRLHPSFAHYAFRDACALPPCPAAPAVVAWLREHQEEFGRVVEIDFNRSRPLVFDQSVGSPEFGTLDQLSSLEWVTARIAERLREAGTPVGIGRYDEVRAVNIGPLFSRGAAPLEEPRALHIGIDLFLEPGTPIFAPLDGKVHSVVNNAAPLDYGPTVILEHEVEPGQIKFYTLYGHLDLETVERWSEGARIAKGTLLGRVGGREVNGGWPPHLHLQLITDLLDEEGQFPAVVPHSQRSIWLSLCPDPNLLLAFPPEVWPDRPLSQEAILASRQRHLGRSLSISYKRPLKMVRGWRQYLYDEAGRAYLDAVNNVSHVGHCHPKVVRALQEQSAVLNTNTRYLHDLLVRYAERLCATLPAPLSVCFFVCTGSEANELALRLARAHTGHHDVIVLDGAYHGNTSSLVELSPYKFDGPGGAGAPPHVQKALMPDPYRGPYRASEPDAGARYAQAVREAIERIHARGQGAAAFFAESLLGCGGQIVLPDNYLQEAYRHVREAGGLCVADEVQVGFGRVGSHFWGFETQGVVPDIVTLGKPIGNGHPLAAVVTTPEIAASFANGMEYFNTFGGNPVSCAVGLAVLDVIEEEGLQENVRRVGARLLEGLERLKERHALIGDVRGLGLYIGIELVRERETLEPAAAQASYLVERMKEEGILLSTDGPLHNVLKIKPPLVFSTENADHLVQTLDRLLSEEPLQYL